MLTALLKTMRPRQWPKNGFVFAGVVFDRQLLNPTALLHTILAFILFCLLSSAVYIINDIADVEADRQHPKKRNRPIARGTLPIPIAIAAAVVFLLIVFIGGYWLSPAFAAIALTYFLLNLAYSKWLKHIPIIDVLVIASGFVLRVAAGVTVVAVMRFSPWLYVVTTLASLYVGFGKRRAELTLLAENAGQHRRVLEGYTLTYLDQLIMVVSSTTIVAYSLYTFTAPNVPENHSMMLTIPMVLYGIFRYLFLIHVKHAGGEPEELLLTDRPLQITAVLWGLAVLFIFYAF